MLSDFDCGCFKRSGETNGVRATQNGGVKVRFSDGLHVDLRRLRGCERSELRKKVVQDRYVQFRGGDETSIVSVLPAVESWLSCGVEIVVQGKDEVPKVSLPVEEFEVDVCKRQVEREELIASDIQFMRSCDGCDVEYVECQNCSVVFERVGSKTYLCKQCQHLALPFDQNEVCGLFWIKGGRKLLYCYDCDRSTRWWEKDALGKFRCVNCSFF